MAKTIKQIKFPKDSVSFSKGWSNNLVKDYGVTQLGIYGLPGTEFCINNNGTIKLNNTGIFQLSCDLYPITSLQISEESYNNCINNHFVIIDIIGEGK